MLLNIFTGAAPPSKPKSDASSQKSSSSSSASSSSTSSKPTSTTSKSSSSKSSGSGHKSASALKYAEKRQTLYQARLQEKYGDKYHAARPKNDDGFDNKRGGMGRDRDRDYGPASGMQGLGGKVGKKEFNVKSKFTREAGSAPKTRAVGAAGAEEALPVTTLQDTKAELLTKEEKLEQQRIGANTQLLTPKTPFGALGLDSELCDYLDAIKFTQPTKIQAAAIPALLSGRDALIQAQTGSGKTLCYLLPVLHALQQPKVRLTRDDGTQAIVLAPTRELAIQIEEVWKQIAKPYYWLIVTTIMGGAKKKSEKARLRKGCHVVIGTPGRIVDHLGSTQSWMLGNVNWFILDEADRLFDLGFREAIQQIYTELINRADNRPRCALVSATLSKKQIRENVFELSSLLLEDPVSIGFDGVTEINDEDDDDDEGNNDDGDDYRRDATRKTTTKDTKKKMADSDDEDNDEDDNDGATTSDDDDDDYNNNDDDDSEDEMDIQKRLLGSTLTGAKSTLKKPLTSIKSISNDSNSSDDGDSDDDDDDDNNVDQHGPQLPPTISLPKSTVSEDMLLPRFREKTMDHLQGLSKYATEQETEEAVSAVTTAFVTPTTLEQLYVKMSSRHRLVALASFLRLRIFNAQQQNKKCKMIVFVSTCASVEFLHKIFQHAYWPDDSVNMTGKYIDDNNTAANIYNYNTKVGGGASGGDVVNSTKMSKSGILQQQVTSNIALAPKLQQAQQSTVKQALINTQLWKLHGNMPQELRTQTYRRFCDATEGILFSTDVAARGLDLPLIDWIVQYDPPEDTEDYIHRIGRTARIGHSGRAILFLLESEEGYLQVLKKQGAANLKQIPLTTLLSGLHVDLPSKSPLLQQNKPLGAILQKQFEKLTTISTHLNTLAKASYIAFVRAYAAYPKTLKGIFHPRRLHLGEVAHSFGLTETPSEITKHSREILRIAEATINPMKVAKDNEQAEADRKRQEHKKSLTRIAAVSEKRQQMAEFL